MGRFEKKAQEAANKIDQKYAADIKSIQAPPEETLAKLFPAEADQQQLSELIQATQKATNDMEILGKIRDASSQLGTTAVKLLRAFILKV